MRAQALVHQEDGRGRDARDDRRVQEVFGYDARYKRRPQENHPRGQTRLRVDRVRQAKIRMHFEDLATKVRRIEEQDAGQVQGRPKTSVGWCSDSSRERGPAGPRMHAPDLHFSIRLLRARVKVADWKRSCSLFKQTM